MFIKIYFLCCFVLFCISVASYTTAMIIGFYKRRGKYKSINITVSLTTLVFVTCVICSIIPIFNIIVTGLVICMLINTIRGS